MGKYQYFSDEEVQGLDDGLCQMLSIARGKAECSVHYYVAVFGRLLRMPLWLSLLVIVLISLVMQLTLLAQIVRHVLPCFKAYCRLDLPE